MKQLLILSLFAMVSCASNSESTSVPSSEPVAASSNKLPKWALDSSSYKGCGTTMLCSVSGADSLNGAKRNARAGISKVFSLKISSTFTSTLSDFGESASEDIEESTDSALSGIEILQIHETDTEYYALAGIDKRKAASGFKREIEELDSEMSLLLKEDTVSASNRIQEAYTKREILNTRYEFLKGKGIPAVIKYEDVFKSKENMKNVIAGFTFKTKHKEVANSLEELLVGMGIKISNDPNVKKTHYFEGSLEAKEQHMNVEGFVKYKFMLVIRSLNNQKVKTGALTFDVVATGRSLEHSYQNALPQIKNYLRENFTKLNIE